MTCLLKSLLVFLVIAVFPLPMSMAPMLHHKENTPKIYKLMEDYPGVESFHSSLNDENYQNRPLRNRKISNNENLRDLSDENQVLNSDDLYGGEIEGDDQVWMVQEDQDDNEELLNNRRKAHHMGGGLVLDLDTVRESPDGFKSDKNEQVDEGFEDTYSIKGNMNMNKICDNYEAYDSGYENFPEENLCKMGGSSKGSDEENISEKNFLKEVTEAPNKNPSWHRVKGNFKKSMKPLCKLYMNHEKSVETLLSAALNAGGPSVHKSLLNYCFKKTSIPDDRNNSYGKVMKSKDPHEGVLSKALHWINRKLGLEDNNVDKKEANPSNEEEMSKMNQPEFKYFFRPDSINVIISPDTVMRMKENVEGFTRRGDLSENYTDKLEQEIWDGAAELLRKGLEKEEHLTLKADQMTPTALPRYRRYQNPAVKRSIGKSCVGRECDIDNLRKALAKIASPGYDTPQDVNELAEIIGDYVHPVMSQRKSMKNTPSKALPKRSRESAVYEFGDAAADGDELYPDALNFFENFTLPPVERDFGIQETDPPHSEFEGSLQHVKNIHELGRHHHPHREKEPTEETGVIEAVKRHFVAFVICLLVLLIVVLIAVFLACCCLRSYRKDYDSNSEDCFVDLDVSGDSFPGLSRSGPKQTRTKSHKDERDQKERSFKMFLQQSKSKKVSQ